MEKDWKHLESNIEKRKGTKSWNYVEKHIVPVLTPLKDINGNNIFTKVNPDYKDSLDNRFVCRRIFTRQLVCLIQTASKLRPKIK